MKKTRATGQILPIVMITLVIFTLMIVALVNWIQNDSKTAVKEQQSTSAINFAEAATDRGQWKLQSTTSTWATAYAGTPISGYNFDQTYNDVPGGTYRIKFSSAANNCMTIIGEGRDNTTHEVRAITAVYKNQVIYSAMMSGGNVSWSKGLVVFWGPIMSQGDITLQDDVVGSMYFPEKYAKGIVTGTATYPRDVNGLPPPNTDNVEWWSEYAGVPPVPVLDFAALRSSAAATGTLNVYGCRSTQGGAGTLGSATAWDTRSSCTSAGLHATHFGNPWSHPSSARLNPNTDYVWYWDGDVTLSGADCGGTACNQSTGLRGTVIVRGNLTVDTPGEFNYSGHVPANAWQEENKLLVNTFDTAAAGEYPGDLGLHTSTGTFGFGTTGFAIPGLGAGPYHTTVGIKGFTYVGGNLTIINYMDFNGAVWINGTVSASGGSISNSCGIFYDDTLNVPALMSFYSGNLGKNPPPAQRLGLKTLFKKLFD